MKQFSGISRPESWGRWSNAQLGDEVKIEYTHPLPEKFDLVITAGIWSQRKPSCAGARRR